MALIDDETGEGVRVLTITLTLALDGVVVLVEERHRGKVLDVQAFRGGSRRGVAR